MKTQIRSMKSSDINQVVEIYCKIFPRSRSTQLGTRYIHKMLYWFITKQASLCFVADENGETTGYIVGAIRGYGRKIFRYAFLEIILGLLMHPTLWFQKSTFALWYSYIQAFTPAQILSERKVNISPINKTPIRAALASVGVQPSSQGKGLGKLLLKAFEQAAKDEGAELLGLSVEIDNLSARKLYEESGWKIDSTTSDLHSAHYSKVIA